jgi:hypothetical protein
VLPLTISNAVGRGVVDGCVGPPDPQPPTATPKAAKTHTKAMRVTRLTKQLEYRPKGRGILRFGDLRIDISPETRRRQAAENVM